ncbi:MAG: hypothetical protein ACXWFY_00380 [Chthoniobacterales bacterium]
MYSRYSLVAAAVALTLFASCDREESAIRSRAQRLVDRRAGAAEAESEFGKAGHVYTRDEVAGYLQKTRAEDRSVRETWERLGQHPRTLYFNPGEMRQLYVFLDDADRVAGYYLTSQ